MKIGLVTIAYTSYGRFLPQWCRFIAAMNKKPTVVTAVLGRNHGLTADDEARCLELLPQLKIVRAEKVRPTMGRLRNVALKHTKTEWVMYISVDDMVLPHAIEEFEKYEAVADYICIRWLTRGLGRQETEHISPLPVDMAKRRGKGFVVAHSPFRRFLWEKTPYEPHDYPNQPFLASCVENGARFVQSARPCTVYLRRSDSHARTVLRGKNPKRGERQKAIRHKRDMEYRIVAYYKRLYGAA